MHLDRVLDLGCGQGGEYIKRDPENRIRVGVDKEPLALELIRARYSLRTCLRDVALPGLRLPFSDGYFQKMECYLPEGSLLDQLVYDRNNLWQEIYRLLSPKGMFEIITETDIGGFCRSPEGSIESKIHFPDIKIAAAAVANNFSASVSAYSPIRFRNLETEWSQKISDLEDFSVKDLYFFWQVEGYKNN